MQLPERGELSSVTDALGTATFSGAPGDYLVILAGAHEVWPPSADGIRSHSETAIRIKLQPGDNKTITVTVDH